MSGAALIADQDRMLVSKVGEQVRVFIVEVGFVAATLVRQAGRLVQSNSICRLALNATCLSVSCSLRT